MKTILKLNFGNYNSELKVKPIRIKSEIEIKYKKVIPLRNIASSNCFAILIRKIANKKVMSERKFFFESRLQINFAAIEIISNRKII